MSTTGKQWILGLYSGASPAPLGGQVVSAKIKKHAENKHESGTGTRTTNLTTTNIYWTIDFKMKVKRLADFFTIYAMPTAEGTLTPFSLYAYDGTTKKGFTGCLVDKASLSLDTEGVLVADASIIASANEVKDLTITERTEAPMTKSALTALSIGASVLTEFSKLKFSVDNHVQKQASGTGDAISDVYAKEATYAISIDLIKKTASKFAYDGTKSAAIVITLANNQVAPVTTTFTFTGNLTSNDYTVEELGITQENVSCAAAVLAIS